MSTRGLPEPVVPPLELDPEARRSRGRLRALFPWPVRIALRLIVIGAVVEFLVLPQLGGSTASWHLLLNFDSPWLAVAVGAECCSLLAFAYGTRAMLPTAVRPSVWRVLRIDLSTIGLSHTMPAGSVAGTGLGLRLLRQAGVPVADAAFGKIAQGVGAVLVLLVLFWTALAVAIPLYGNNPIYLSVTLVGLVVLVVATVLVLLLHRARERAARALARVTAAVPFLADDSGHRVVMKVGAQFDVVIRDKRRLAAAIGFAALNWLCDATALWASVRVFGHTLGYVGLMVPYCLGQAAGWIPITPGGLGLVEGILVPTIVGFGTTRTVAILGVILWRLLAFWLPIPLGALAYGSLVHTHRQEDKAAAAASREPAGVS